MSRVSFSVAVGAAKLITNNLQMLNAVGLTPEEHDLIIQEEQWTSQQRQTVTAALKQMCFATIANVGLPPIKLPTEYVAGVILATVSPVNYILAAYWMAMDGATGAPAEELADRYSDGIQRATAEELVATLVRVFSQPNSSRFNQTFAKYVQESTGAKE